LACSFRRFRRFEHALNSWLESAGNGPALTFIGSGDFHHVSLALVRRQQTPINLLVIDNHPDWMRWVPFLHCGTWLYHAARLTQVERVIHVGGDVDFDNAYQGMAPWQALRSGKISVMPAIRHYVRGRWKQVLHTPLRQNPATPATSDRINMLLQPLRAELARRPLYISLDKDVLTANEALVNWDSGHLMVPEVAQVMEAFVQTAHGRLAGMDIVGDWSPVQTQGMLRRWMHWTMHPALKINPAEATRRNEELNLRLHDLIEQPAPTNI
jgi:arginase family enzyme